MVLLARSTAAVDPTLAIDHAFLIPVIKDAILGSILANLLLCLGICFFVGGMRQETTRFDSAISEVGGGLLLTAGVGLAVPRAFYIGLVDELGLGAADDAAGLIFKVSRATAVVLLLSFVMCAFPSPTTPLSSPCNTSC